MNSIYIRAFTLIELLVTVAVLSVLLGIAIPSFRSLVERHHRSTASLDLLEALNHARGLAVTRRERISLCAGIDICNASADWEDGIIIFSDPNQNGTLDAGEQLHRVTTLPDEYHWNWSNFRSRTFMTYKANGTTDSLNGTYTLCSRGEAIQQLVINITGRLRTRSPEGNGACT